MHINLFLVGNWVVSPTFSDLSNLASISLTNIPFHGFLLKNLSLKNRRGIPILFPKYDKIDKHTFE